MRGDLPRISFSSKKKDKATFFSPTDEWSLPAASRIKQEQRKFVVDSRANMHMVSRKGLNCAELDTVKLSQNPTTVPANGEVLTKEEATEYVKELDLFVTVMLLEDTPAVLSLGKHCEDHEYNHHWTSGHKPHFIKKQKDRMQHGELHTIRCPWSIDKLFKLIFTYISDIFIAGTRNSYPASRISKE